MAWNPRPRAVTAVAVAVGAEVLTPTMSAPAWASATAMPCPSPVLHPVTIATFPDKSKSFSILFTSTSGEKGIHQ